MLISIVIVTFRRQATLRTSVQSCLRQEQPRGFQFEIVVVDNCPDRSAYDTVEALRSDCEESVVLRYVHQPLPGISNARNLGVREARGEFLVFLDDDQKASPELLAAYVQTWQATKASIIAGPVIAVPAERDVTVDPGILAYFARDFALSDQADLSGYCARMGSNNVFLWKERCFTSEAPFDVTLGHFGGEDSLFFRRMLHTGQRIVWSKGALAYEMVSHSRLNHDFVKWRRFRSGQIRTLTCLWMKPKRRMEALLWMGVGLAQVCLFGGLAGAMALFGRPGWRLQLTKAFGGAGKFMLSRRFRFDAYGPAAELGR